VRQVPEYLIIGNGRVSRNFQHYFNLLALPFNVWHRKLSESDLKQKTSTASHILVLTSDQAIESIVKTVALPEKYWIHFSGALVTNLAFGAHPLMTFNESLYSYEEYSAIPFVLDHDAPAFDRLLPGLQNPHVRLQKDLKPKYHALCVAAGNFSCLLWQKLFSTFENDFNIPSSYAHPYLQKQTENLIQDYTKALTGPLVRHDQTTIKKNLSALTADPFQQIYESFLLCYQKMQEGV